MINIIDEFKICHKYSVPENISIDTIGDECIVYFNDDKKIIILNNTATYIINLVNNSDKNIAFTYDQIALLLEEHFKAQSECINIETIISDIVECFKLMENNGLIYEENNVEK